MRNYVDFGYGNTVGILGYNKQLGVLSIFNVSRTSTFMCLCALYIMIFIAFIYKFTAELEQYDFYGKDNFVKIIKVLIIAMGGIVEIREMFAYFISGRLRGIFLLSVICYLGAYLMGKSVLKIKYKQ